MDEDFITSDRFLKHTNGCGFCSYVKTDLFWLGGAWRGQEVKSLMRTNRKKRRILVCGHSDNRVTYSKLIAARIKGYKSVYGINLNPTLPGSYSLPLGLTNDTDESPLHRLFGDTKGILNVIDTAERPTQYSNNLYANFTLQNNSGERGKIVKILDGMKILVNSPDMTHTGRVEYLKKLRTADFVLCPEGNGIDTHRIWETLYVGGTPIVKSNPVVDSLLTSLPVLLIENWEEISDTSKMKSKWEKLQSQAHHADELRFSYWEKILSDLHLG